MSEKYSQIDIYEKEYFLKDSNQNKFYFKNTIPLSISFEFDLTNSTL